MIEKITEITKNAAACLPSEKIRKHLSVYNLFRSKEAAPRYYQSLIALGCHPKEYLHVYYRDCLLILKRKWVMGNPVLYLMLPPVHKAEGYADPSIESSVMEELRHLGIGARMTEEDIARFGVSRSDTTLASSEWLYRAGDMTDLSGGSHAAVRGRINQAKRLISENNMSLSVYDHRTDKGLFNVDAGINLARVWGEQKAAAVAAGKGDNDRKSFKNPGVPPAFAAVRDAGVASLAHVLTCPKHGQAGFSYSERVAGGAVIVLRLRNYECTECRDPDIYMHYLDLSYWAEKPDTVLNYGGGTSESGDEHKRRLKACGEMKIYAVKGYRKMTGDEWKASCQPVAKPKSKNLMDYFIKS